MSNNFKNFLNDLSEEQLHTLKQLLNEENLHDQNTTATKKGQKINEKEEKEQQQAEQGTEINQEEKINQKTKDKINRTNVINEDFTVTRNNTQTNRKVPVRYKRNEWKDVGEHHDIDTPNFEKTPRNRNKPKRQKVECHVCGKTFSINPALAFGEYHRCNKCTG